MKSPPSEFIRGFLYLKGINPDVLVPAPPPLPAFPATVDYTLFLLVPTAPLPLIIIIQYPQTASPKEETAHYSHYLTICFR